MFLVDFDATIINWKSLPNSGWDLQCGIEGACQPKRVVSAIFSSASLLLSHVQLQRLSCWVRERLQIILLARPTSARFSTPRSRFHLVWNYELPRTGSFLR